MGGKLQSLDPEAVSASNMFAAFAPLRILVRQQMNKRWVVAIAKMPLTPLGLHVSHQIVHSCLLAGLPMLHASHKVSVQGELLAGGAKHIVDISPPCWSMTSDILLTAFEIQ